VKACIFILQKISTNIVKHRTTIRAVYGAIPLSSLVVYTSPGYSLLHQEPENKVVKKSIHETSFSIWSLNHNKVKFKKYILYMKVDIFLLFMLQYFRAMFINI